MSANPLVGGAVLGVRSAAGFDAAVPPRLVWGTGTWTRGRVVAAMLGLPAGDPS